MFLRILVPLDGSPLAERALDMTTLLAQRKAASDGSFQPLVILFRAVDLSLWLDLDLESARAQAMEAASRYLEEQAETLRREGITVETAVRLGNSAETILEHTLERQADLIVMSTHGRSGLARWALGSVAERVVRTTSVPVLLIPDAAPASLAGKYATETTLMPRLLVPLDGSAIAEASLGPATELAALLDAEMRLLYVFIPRFEEATGTEDARFWDRGRRRVHQIERYLMRKTDEAHQAGVKVRWGLGYGMPVPKIIDSAREHRVDMIVMTTQGHGGPTHWRLGRVVEGVLQQGRMPVLIVPVQAAVSQAVKVGSDHADLVTP